MDKEAIRQLMADYLEGELDEADRGTLADALEREPELAIEFDEALWVEGLLHAASDRAEVEKRDTAAPVARAVGPSGRFTIPQSGDRIPRISKPVWLGLAATLLLGAVLAFLALRPDGRPHEGPSLLAGAVEVNGASRSQVAPGELVRVVGQTPAVIRLDDASTAELDPGSRVVFKGAQDELRQLVELHAGKGSFKVAHLPRAFRVATPVGAVTVTGTEFTVALREEEGSGATASTAMRVTVTTGSVAVEYQGRELALRAGDERDFGIEEAPALRGAYAANGELHVNALGTPEGPSLTTGHLDTEPSWSKTDGMLVFFRVTKFAKEVRDWKTAVCTTNVDGTGFQQLTDGTHTDFGPTWTRDGSNRILFNRQDTKTRGYVVMQSKTDGKPGDEIAISDTSCSTYAHTCLMDGRILVSSSQPTRGYYLMTPGPDGTARYEPLRCELPTAGALDQVSISPSETKVCFEIRKEGNEYWYPGRTLYIADFDAKARTITNPRSIANGKADPGVTCLCPRWTKDESGVVYSSNETGKSQLYLYRLADGLTTRLSTNAGADYLAPCGEATPK